MCRDVHVTSNVELRQIVILEWTTSLDTSSRTLFVRMSTSRRTSSYVITSDCY